MIRCKKLNKKHKIPKCKPCDIPMKLQGTFSIGLYEGGVALYECSSCKAVQEVDVKPTRCSKKKHKAFLRDMVAYKESRAAMQEECND